MNVVARIRLNEGDRATPAKLHIVERDGTDKDLSSYTFTFTMKPVGSATAKVDAQACTFVSDGTDGMVQYAWGASDLDTPGDYWGWFTGTVGGKNVNYPQNGLILVEVGNLP